MNLDKNELFIVRIEENHINLLQCKNNNINSAKTILIPESAFKNNEILDVDTIAEKINEYKNQYEIQSDRVVFIISGTDILIRNTEVPIMEKSKILDAAKWEITQYLPEQGENHYIDYEIVKKINDKDKKIYSVLVCAAPKEKIDKYKELADKTNLKLTGIEVAANCLARIFKNSFVKDKQLKDIGIIKIGTSTTDFIMLKNGKLLYQREVPFGKENIINQLVNTFRISESEAIDSISNANLNDIEGLDEKSLKIKKTLDNILNSFEKNIQFYFTGNTKKKLNKVFFIGDISKIIGLKKYSTELLNTEVENNCDNLYKELGISYVSDLRIDDFLFEIGVVLRKDKDKSINLIPDSIKEKSNTKISNNVKYGSLGIFGILLLVFIGLFLYSIILKNNYTKVQNKLEKYGQVSSENKKLSDEANLYTKDISLYNKLKNNNDYTSQWIEGIQKYVTPDIKLTSIAKANSEYTITGSTSNNNSTSIFVANLQQSDKYSSAKLISVISDGSSFKFTINMGVETK